MGVEKASTIMTDDSAIELLAKTEVFDLESKTWTEGPKLDPPRILHDLTSSPQGEVHQTNTKNNLGEPKSIW